MTGVKKSAGRYCVMKKRKKKKKKKSYPKNI
jgi:hypothetical protein